MTLDFDRMPSLVQPRFKGGQGEAETRIFQDGMGKILRLTLEPSSPIGKDTALAFVVGGGICAVGQLIANGWQALGLTQQEAASATSVTLVFLSVLLTALGLYHRLARYAGAGTLVPITGFANAVASPAIDFRAEGIVTGTAVKLFTVAGPVIVFGTAASVVYGLVLYLLG